MSNETVMLIAISDARRAAEKVDGDIVARLRAAMKETKDHWIVTTEDDRFKAAVGGVMETYGEDSPEWDSLAREVKSLGRFSSALAASQADIPVDWVSLLGEISDETDSYKPLGLLKIWREVKKGKV